MKTINGATVTLGVMEKGQFVVDIDEALAEVLRKTKLAADNHKDGKAKGALTITIGFAIEGDMITLSGDIKPKTPPLPRRSTPLFITADAQISTQHPSQGDMFDGPREVSSRG